MTRGLSPRAVTAVMVLLMVASSPACITASQVSVKQAELSQLLDGIDTRARVCAPRALAQARAHLVFGAWESEQGQTLRARVHMDRAEKEAQRAWERSREDACELDSDYDGIRDRSDKCPLVPEDFDGDQDEDGCPEEDRDGDGVDDDRDRCPDDPEDMDGYQDEDGCPDPDNDGDGIFDRVDQCPMAPEDKDGFEDIDGCPDPDNDGDGLLDADDRCPNEPEDMDGVDDEDGCPDVVQYKSIVITEDRIELKQKIFFSTGKARILPRSYGLLDEVAMAMARKAELTIRIEGHTDSRGGARFNRRLSQQRADAVRQYLVRAGISGDRLFAMGYGEDRPIDSNDSSTGRSRNRRVEFHILR